MESNVPQALCDSPIAMADLLPRIPAEEMLRFYALMETCTPREIAREVVAVVRRTDPDAAAALEGRVARMSEGAPGQLMAEFDAVLGAAGALDHTVSFVDALCEHTIRLACNHPDFHAEVLAHGSLAGALEFGASEMRREAASDPSFPSERVARALEFAGRWARRSNASLDQFTTQVPPDA